MGLTNRKTSCTMFDVTQSYVRLILESGLIQRFRASSPLLRLWTLADKNREDAQQA